MARPKKSKELQHKNIITLRVSDIELDYIDTVSSSLNISRSEYLRKLMQDKEIHNRIYIVADIPELQKLTSEFGRIGNILNQIAKFFNTGGLRSKAMQDEIHQCINQS